MKKKMMRLLTASLVCVILATVTSGCNGTPGEEVVVSEDVSSDEEVSEDTSLNTPSDNKSNEEASEETSSEEESSAEETSEETSSEVSEEPSEEASEEKTEEPSEEKSEEPAYTVEDMDATMYAQRSVNVRKGPSTDYEKIGGLNQNDEVHVTGKASTGWYRIDYKGSVGFVANSYLGNDKVVAPPPTEKPPVETTPEQPAPDQPAPEQPPSQPGLQDGAFLNPEMLQMINSYRAEVGMPAVTWNSGKEAEALARATYIGVNKAINHDGMPSGATAEVIAPANGFSDAEGVQAAWRAYMKSQGHCSSIAWELNTSCVAATYRVVDSLTGLNGYYNVIIFY